MTPPPSTAAPAPRPLRRTLAWAWQQHWASSAALILAATWLIGSQVSTRTDFASTELGDSVVYRATNPQAHDVDVAFVFPIEVDKSQVLLSELTFEVDGAPASLDLGELELLAGLLAAMVLVTHPRVRASLSDRLALGGAP